MDSEENLKKISLHGSEWRLIDSEQKIGVPLAVPGYAIEALQNAGLIQDPLFRKNEVEYTWIARSVWDFERNFDLDPSDLVFDQIDLVMDGIDTFATLNINGKDVGQMENAHREHRFMIKSHLRSGSNTIRIRFASAADEVEKRSKLYPYPVPTVTHNFKHFNFARKAACDFGWDWGPGFGQCGIYGRVELHAYSVPYLQDFHVSQKHDGDKVGLHIKCKLQSIPGKEFDGAVTFSIPELNISETKTVELKGQDSLIARMDEVVVKEPYNLWWPHDMGKQFLYTADIKFKLKKSPQNEVESSRTKKIGLRNVELVRQSLGNEVEGESFYFRVNGVPIFAKGANIIPMDIIHSKPTENEIRRMTADAREANMNMLRVWGGGNYFSHTFYDACDELGVLVWQEAMFACGMYPRHEPFLKEVEHEVSFQAFRLGSHPSIVIWGGNNENENSMDWFKVTWDNRIRYAVDLCKIFVDTVGAALNKVDPHILYIDTSPSNGVISEDPYVKRYGNTNCIDYGDVHFYDYVNDGLSYSTFPKAKFVSEFGFQSFPSFEAYRAVSRPEDWSYDSELSEFRQRHPNGNKELLSQLERHFTVPLARDPDGNPKRQELLFKHWIYLTQLHQALCYDTAVRYWRSLKSDPKALTRGALYWQLNDIWQGPSWSGINYGGQWKLLHYMARQFFAPFAISTRFHKANQMLEIHATSDVNSELQVSIEGKVIPLKGEPTGPVETIKETTNLLPDETRAMVSLPVDDLFPVGSSYTKHNCLLHIVATATFPPTAAATDVSKSSNDVPESSFAKFGELKSETIVMFVPWKDATLEKRPEIESGGFTRVDARTVKFVLRAKLVMPHVALESAVAGVFSENIFLIVPWETREIVFKSREDMDIDEFEDTLQIFTPVGPVASGWLVS